MFMPILSGLVVSVDAFFIGLSLGLQKKCKFVYIAFINIFLLLMCIIGFLGAELFSNYINIDTNLVVGFTFIALGLWCICYYFIYEHAKQRIKTSTEQNSSKKSTMLVGFVMSVEAMFITMGITLIFAQNSTLIIPLAVAFSHFGYSSFSFNLARTKYIRRIPTALSQLISGLSLITYGLMAIFIEITI